MQAKSATYFRNGQFMDDIRAIGLNIRNARKVAGITQGTLADLIGTSARTVHAIETGTGNPSLHTVVAAANAVGLRLGTIDG
ncbi:helix-turn-helix domain-containing protein [Paenarthrobacter nicotinovorans]|uniref:helix-turn-helix domain-containing protein n=1 Tax=Paenarthrobacter nicotinovorans TaxID=29320 RepID=UPI0027839295|nr:helix-turn-helix transcriptional regulator [Paenarthrobacter nicotinovorans]MDP9936091.1 DNA-binding XRE family transcriptional regulator [Paenarthrobacter nicotinovorans]